MEETLYEIAAQIEDAGTTALHKASKNNDLSLISQLLSEDESDFDVDSKDDCDRTPLHVASTYCRRDSHFCTIELLLKNGAKVDVQDMWGKTPLAYLVKKASVKTIKLLLDSKADVNLEDDEGETPLFPAVCREDMEIVRLLVDQGADVNQSTEDGKTPLHKACLRNNLEIIKYLLRSGAKIDALDYKGRTPLMRMISATAYSNKRLVFLLKYSNVNIINSRNRNIMSYDLDFSSSMWKIVVEHFAKIQALGLPLDSRILQTILSSEEYDEYFLECTQELTLAKSTRPSNSWITFFDLLTDNRRKLKNYAGNEDLLSDFDRSDYLKKFPIFGNSMQQNVAKGLKRRELFYEAAELLSDCLPVFNPTHLVIRDVLDQLLSTKDLSKLCDC